MRFWMCERDITSSFKNSVKFCTCTTELFRPGRLTGWVSRTTTTQLCAEKGLSIATPPDSGVLAVPAPVTLFLLSLPYGSSRSGSGAQGWFGVVFHAASEEAANVRAQKGLQGLRAHYYQGHEAVTVQKVCKEIALWGTKKLSHNLIISMYNVTFCE